MNKKGTVSSKILLLIVLFVLIIAVFGIFFIWSLVAPLVEGTGGQMITQIKGVIANNNNGDTALSNATNVSADMASGILGTFELFTYLGFICFFLVFIIICFYIRTYPFLAFFWIFMIIALVFFGMILSNSYETASRSTADLTAFYTSWGTNDFLMLNLPMIILVFGIIGGVILFVLISREPEAEATAI